MIKHPLLSNLIRFISIYFLRDAYFFHEFFKSALAGRNLSRVEFTVVEGQL